MTRRCLLVLIVGLLTGVSGARSRAQEAERLAHFENAVRPLLVETCLKCHGPQKSESGLRLDSRDRMLQGGDSGPAVVPGNAAGSLLLQAVRHEDGLAMPPTGRLKPEQVTALERWIADGAAWSEGSSLGGTSPGLRSGPITDAERAFWSFQPLAQPAVPVSDPTLGARTPIDGFVLDRLGREGLTLRPPAGKRALLRRVTFDLTGLPPTPAEIDAFLADTSPLAYERVVERLLASPAYGERWGRHWLDVVRYADTAGETADYPTPLSYKYRNWVIRAFNADLPYDQFLRMQLAGDLLAAERDRAGAATADDAEAIRDALTATGFLAISRRFGFDIENYHHLTIQDTIDTVGQSMLGLSLGCARCHDHKFDPITQADYYGWYGIFAGTQYSFPGSEEKKRPRDLVPDLAPSQLQARQAQHQAGLAALKGQIEAVEADLKRQQEPIAAVLGSDVFTGFEHESLGQGPTAPYNSVAGARVSTSAQSPFQNVYPRGTRGVSFPRNAENNAFGLTMPPRTAEQTPVLHYSIDFRTLDPVEGATGSYRFYLGHGPGPSGAVIMAASASMFSIQDGSQFVPIAPLRPGVWYNVQVTLDLKARTYQGVLTGPNESHRFAQRAVAQGWDGTIDYTFVDRYGPGPGDPPAHEVDNLALGTEPFPAADTVRPDSESRSARIQALAEATAAVGRLRQQVAELKTRHDRLAAAGPIPAERLLYGAVEASQAGDVPVQLRGEPTRPGPVASRRNLEILGGEPRPEGPGSGRRALADWITRPGNPLTARVLVNRVWQYHFGRGLVGSSNDFGVRGDRPTHPELLDWLADEFLRSGQSLKALHRLILHSAVYQQGSDFDSQAAERDPDATLLWRFNRRRLSAEELRDAMLLVSGGLDRSMGGPHPFPAIETWGFSQHSPFYAVYPSDHRSVYLMQQRLKRHPYLALFDGSDPNASTARRSVTTVPTQTLYLMNNEFVHRCADDRARRLLAEGSPSDASLDALLVETLGRPAEPGEIAELREFVAGYTPEPGESVTPPQAGWAAVIRTLLTRNEFLFVD